MALVCLLLGTFLPWPLQFTLLPAEYEGPSPHILTSTYSSAWERWSLKELLICISLMAKMSNFLRSYVYLLTIYISSFEDCLFHLPSCCLDNLVWGLFVFWSSPWILDDNPLSDALLAEAPFPLELSLHPAAFPLCCEDAF